MDITRATISGPTRFSNSDFLILTHLKQLESLVAEDASAAVGSYHIECVLTKGRPVFFFNPSAAGCGRKSGEFSF